MKRTITIRESQDNDDSKNILKNTTISLADGPIVSVRSEIDETKCSFEELNCKAEELNCKTEEST